MTPSSLPPIVLSVGGSIVVPKTGIDVAFLQKFRTLIRTEIARGHRFIIVVGGGMTARTYQQAAGTVTQLTAEDLDWLGIHATRLNGHLLRTVFRAEALHRVVKDPTRTLVWREPVLIAAGWKPGWSTDYIAVRMAKKYGARRVINLTNIRAVYDKDPSLHDDAVPRARMTWTDYRHIAGSVWKPGVNLPFDPIASKLAQQCKMDVVIAQGTDLANLHAIIAQQPFQGTVISDAEKQTSPTGDV